MANRKSARKRSPAKKPGPSLAEILLRPGLVGSVLVLVAVFTLLSLVAGSRGTVTTSWVAWLRSAFGDGIWAVPIVTGVVGLAMVFAAMDGREAPQWRRPLGILVLFAALLIGLSLSLPPELRSVATDAGNAGGWLGTELANALQRTVTQVGAWSVVAFLVVSGMILVLDALLTEIVAATGVWMRERAARRAEPPADFAGSDGQQLPLFVAHRSAGRSLGALLGGIFQRRSPPAENAPPVPPVAPLPAMPARSLVQPVAPAPDAPPPPVRGAIQSVAEGKNAPANTVAARASVAPAGQPAPQRPTEILQPRIIGGVQEWKLPAVADMLSDHERHTDSDDYIRKQGRLIQDTLALFGVPAEFEGAYKGPSVTQYLIKPGYVEKTLKGEPQKLKVKVAKIASLSNDLALALEASSVRIEAPIPGTSYVGIEVPNRESNVVGLKELMESESYLNMKGRLKIALGEDVKGQAVTADLARMPHLLIAGATGSGKSVCINSIITCLLLTNTPDSLRLLMVDPKMVELSVYNGVPHLLSPVVTEVDKAAGVLFWAVKEMERRYTLFSKAGARDLIRFNETLTRKGEKALPYIVVIVDEMADLMMAAPEEVEKHICRLAQMARATGIHLIIATQRPSVDVITGLIKANFPSRISFAVTSQIDSRVILDIPGAERLLGRGDMLFMAPDAGKLERLQGTWLSDDEINKVVRYWKGIRILESQPVAWQLEEPAANPATDPALPPMAGPSPDLTAPVMGAGTAAPAVGLQRLPAQSGVRTGTPSASEQPLFEQIEALKAMDGRDVLFEDALRTVQEAGKGSVSLLQKKLRIGYGRASRLIEQLEEAGVVGPDQGGTVGRPLTGRAPAAPVPSAPSPAASAPTAASSAPVFPSAGGSEESSATPSAAPPRNSRLPNSRNAPSKAAPADKSGPDVWM